MATKRVRVRMYRTGLGDCFLLTFPGKGTKSVHMLIDCGVFRSTPGEKARLIDVARHIRRTTSGRLDILAATHEHYDHLIGFKHARDVFAGMSIGTVWLPWTEKPGDPRAAWLRAAENKLKRGLQLALEQARADPALAARAGRLESLLEFGGNPLAANYSEQMGEIRNWLRDDAADAVEYLEPHGRAIEIAPSVRVYPLGPPIDPAFFRKLNDSPSKPETYGAGFAYSAVPAFLQPVPRASPGESRSLQGVAEPFDHHWKIREVDAPAWRIPVRPDQERAGTSEGEAYFAARYGFGARHPDAWRHLDDDWLAEAENLALQLDSLTNNSSLALAIEVGKARRVILMAADAQVGSWLSWHEGAWTAKGADGEDEVVTAPGLLGRTVLYKVGHHGSHNATLKEKGLELMTSDELVAMIPVDQDFANNTKHWKMPFPALLAGVARQTRGRVLRADHGLPARNTVDAAVRSAFFKRSRVEPLFVDHFIPG